MQHDRLTHRRHSLLVHHVLLLNPRLELILGKSNKKKIALFKIEETLHLGIANLKDEDRRLFRVNNQ